MKTKLLLATLFVGFLTFLPSSAHATSAYDDRYQSTNLLSLGASDYGSSHTTCDYQDLTQSWYQKIVDLNYTDGNGKNFSTNLQNAINGDGRWAVSQTDIDYNDGSGTYSSITVFFTEDDSLYLDWTHDTTSIWARGNNLKSIRIVNKGAYLSSSSCDLWLNYSDGAISALSQKQSSASIIKNLFVFSDHLNYPIGYAGQQIPDHYTSYPNPEFTIKQDVRSVVLTPTNLQDFQGADDCWFQVPVNHEGDNFEELHFNCGNFPISYDFDYYGDKNISLFVSMPERVVSSVVQTIHIDAPTPTYKFDIVDKHVELTPTNLDNFQGADDCWFQVPTNEEGDQFEELHFDCAGTPPVPYDFDTYGNKIVILFVSLGGDTLQSINGVLPVDGGFHSGSMGNVEKSIYEDCSSYDYKVKLFTLEGGHVPSPSTISCWVRNVGRFINWLIIPDSQMMYLAITDIKSFFMQKLGFLSWSVQWIIDTFTPLVGLTGDNCVVSYTGVPYANLDATFFGSHVNINPCSAEQSFPKIYAVVVFFVRIGTVMALIWALYGNLYYIFGKQYKEEHNGRTY